MDFLYVSGIIIWYLVVLLVPELGRAGPVQTVMSSLTLISASNSPVRTIDGLQTIYSPSRYSPGVRVDYGL